MTRSFSPEPFGRYFLFDRMAVGGMAEIFRAVQLNDGGFQRVVVIKRILAHLNAEQQFIDMFLNEARITSTLSHPNIVQIYDFDSRAATTTSPWSTCRGRTCGRS